MKTTFPVIVFLALLTGCQFSKSVEKDLISGLTTRGNNISCEEVYLTVNNERSTRNSFIYGEIFFLNFSDVRGLAKEKGNVFPGMDMIVINESGDTLMNTGDLLAGYTEGMNYSPLLLTADLTVANPIKSKDDYKLFVNIWDKKGKGRFVSEFDFKVRENDKIIVEPYNVAYDEVYIFSRGLNKVITDNKVKLNDNVYIIIEGLKGFIEENGLVFPGLSMKATDTGNSVVLVNDDLFSNYSESGIDPADLTARVSANFKITGNQINNPLHCEIIVWDKKSEARIKATMDMFME